MRRIAVMSVVVAVLVPLVGCSGDESVTMPDVVGKRLDIAISDVERAGFDDEVEVLGGGSFGVLNESNWTVCSQEPREGDLVSVAPRITVDRTCDTDDALDPATADEEQVSGNDAADTAAEDTTTASPTKRTKKKRQPVASVPETFMMPSLVGVNLQEAQNLLQARGSFLLTQTDGAGQGRFQMLDLGWKVCAQDPAAGTETDILTLVELITVKLSEAC
jgi:beta-lactam-binding protein with PASTA domain